MHQTRQFHLEMIQTAITRMAQNSFLLKGWSVTLVAALFALAAKDTKFWFVVLALLPAIAFWLLDGYYLSLERQYRALYDEIRCSNPGEPSDLSMDASRFNHGANRLWPSCHSIASALFHGPILAVIFLVICVLARG